MSIERIAPGGEGEAGKLYFLAFLASNTRTGDRDAATAEGDFALRRSGSSRSSLGISLPPGTAEILAILFHHRTQHLLACVDAEIEERVLDVEKGSQQRERDLYGHRLRKIDGLEMNGLLGMLRHGGGSFVGLVTPSVTHGG
jgi:hypothetical protein